MRRSKVTVEYDRARRLTDLSIDELLLEIGRTAVLIFYAALESTNDPELRAVMHAEMTEFFRRSPDERERGMIRNETERTS